MATFKVGDRIITNTSFNHGAGIRGTITSIGSFGDLLHIKWDNPKTNISTGEWFFYKFDKLVENIDDELDAIPIAVSR